MRRQMAIVGEDLAGHVSENRCQIEERGANALRHVRLPLHDPGYGELHERFVVREVLFLIEIEQRALDRRRLRPSAFENQYRLLDSALFDN